MPITCGPDLLSVQYRDGFNMLSMRKHIDSLQRDEPPERLQRPNIVPERFGVAGNIDDSLERRMTQRIENRTCETSARRIENDRIEFALVHLR